MNAKFVSEEKRDELVKRLLDLAHHMLRSWDQGNDGTIAVTDWMIGDIQTAAACVRLCEIDPTPPHKSADAS